MSEVDEEEEILLATVNSQCSMFTGFIWLQMQIPPSRLTNYNNVNYNKINTLYLIKFPNLYGRSPN